ncbi:unnamed protein product [Periconia digitata]|uniref:Uncharacterized protein n=1 Tax=Periconia digitata TaxID=1303443 RepID=A0A9W4XKI5_9PLEO|nr:unnamed protein product [Periconia digitata]
MPPSNHIMGFWEASGKFFSDTWALELLLLLVSWIALFTTVGLLLRYNQQPIFTWLNVSLNAMVSVLGIVFKSSLLFVLSSCLGQWTYISFSGPQRQPLFNFITYDSASRGPFGSLLLLWRTRMSSWAAIGACTVVIAFFVDPFLQQIISLRETQTASILSPPSVPLAIHYDKGIERSTNVALRSHSSTLSSVSDFSMQAAILSGLSGAKGVQAIEVRCPTAICQWGNFKTLGVCSTFKNLTGEISKISKLWNSSIPAFAPPVSSKSRISQRDRHNDKLSEPWKITNVSFSSPNSSSNSSLSDFFWSVQRSRLGDDFSRPINKPNGTLIDYYYLPNHLYVETYKWNEIRMVSLSGKNRSKTISYKDQKTMLWSFAVLQDTAPLQDIEDPAQPVHSFIAYEVSLSMCVKEITSRSINGTLDETSRDINASVVKGGGPKNEEVPDMNPGMLAQSYEESRDDLEFEGGITIAQHSLNGIASALRTAFAITTEEDTTGYYISGNYNGIRYAPNSMERVYNSPDPKALFENVAESMTNNLRTNDAQASLARGTQEITVYWVRWAWISLPAAALWGGTVFLFVTIHMTRKYRASLWKSCALAMLKSGEKTAGAFDNCKSVSAMEGVAEKTFLANLK